MIVSNVSMFTSLLFILKMSKNKTKRKFSSKVEKNIITNNSVTPQDINMKFFKFTLTPMGVILHMATILINFRCCHGKTLL